MGTWSTICDSLARGDYCVMVGILEARGSAPREAGARMVVLHDGSFTGTIGGGALEWRAIAEARRAIAKAKSDRAAPPVRQSQQALGPDLGQCCGGSVRLLWEVFDPAQKEDLQALKAAERRGAFATEGRILEHHIERTILTAGQQPDPALLSESFGQPKQTLALFGAGHVGRALVLALAPLNFKVFWIDPRADAFPSIVPGDVTVTQTASPVDGLADLPDQAFVIVMTHSHGLDFDVVWEALRQDRFSYVGLIGSNTKRARFRRRLRQAGLAAREIDRLVCPIGIPGINSKEPSAIAASVVADLLCRMEQWAGKVEDTVPMRIKGGR
ncbi:MAG: xanthine dehydrogenase accessory protein XdhC [Alphaproteobacteria bacterium]|jgi:xanthine dehydrogenase accessory factor